MSNSSQVVTLSQDYRDILEDVAFKAGILHTNTTFVEGRCLMFERDWQELGEALHRYYKAQRTHAQPRLFAEDAA